MVFSVLSSYFDASFFFCALIVIMCIGYAYRYYRCNGIDKYFWCLTFTYAVLCIGAILSYLSDNYAYAVFGLVTFWILFFVFVMLER